MEIKVLDENDIELLKDILEEDSNMLFNVDNIRSFMHSPNTYGFVVKNDNKVIGFAYGHGLTRPDGKIMFYLHDIGLLKEHRDKGIGSQFMKFIFEFAKNNNFSEVFLITDRGNPRACRVFEKTGLTSGIPNEICYVYEFIKES